MILTYTTIGLMAASTLHAMTRPFNRHLYATVRLLRPRHFLANVPALVAVLVSAHLLTRLPGLGWGWFSAIGGQGNAMLGVTTHSGWLASSVTVTMLVILTVAMPVLVRVEEDVFRAGSEHRSRGGQVRTAFLFGVAHVVAGVPVGTAIALSIAGMWFTWVYMRGFSGHRLTSSYLAPAAPSAAEAAVRASTLAHLAWNYTAVALVVVTLVA